MRANRGFSSSLFRQAGLSPTFHEYCWWLDAMLGKPTDREMRKEAARIVGRPTASQIASASFRSFLFDFTYGATN